MTAPAAALEGLRRRRPEWAPWLAVVEEIARETAGSGWDAAVPGSLEQPAMPSPLLTGATLRLRAQSVRNLLERLLRIASRCGAPKMATLDSALRLDLEPLSLFGASLSQDTPRIVQLAHAAGADAEAFEAVVALLPVPFLQACNRRLESLVPASWMEGYCPLCGSWPAFAEVRGIERSRHFRCGRCGSAWHSRSLHCPYCANDDHGSLVSLVPGNGGSNGVVEACRQCEGYVKALTRLQGCDPAVVGLEDLSTVDLDVAAVEQGYRRPSGAACAIGITVTESGYDRARPGSA